MVKFVPCIKTSSPLCWSFWLFFCWGSKADPGKKSTQQSSGQKTPSGGHKSRWEAPTGWEWYSGEGGRSGVSGSHLLCCTDRNVGHEQLYTISAAVWIITWCRKAARKKKKKRSSGFWGSGLQFTGELAMWIKYAEPRGSKENRVGEIQREKKVALFSGRPQKEGECVYVWGRL